MIRPALAAGTVLCRLDAIPDNDCLEVAARATDPTLRIVVMRSGCTAWAYRNCCPHFSLPLNGQNGRFLIVGPTRLMCAYHCAVFRFEDGFCLEGPAVGMRLEKVPVAVVEGEVRVA
jgi:nitrite reductase/ring-hydroxylating ferredoxin subunit